LEGRKEGMPDAPTIVDRMEWNMSSSLEEGNMGAQIEKTILAP
jgi:hypothetical protein